MQEHNTINEYESQAKQITKNLAIKKNYNNKIIDWLQKNGESERAEKIANCGQHVGITNIAGVAKIIKADFCRERLCNICAWRRQSKFLAQMFPVIDSLERDGYQFIFATLTIKNTDFDSLSDAIDNLMIGFERLRHRRKITRSWRGICRSIELTYNEQTDTFHPHIHLLIAVDNDYFTNTDKYITQSELLSIWRDCMRLDYFPSVDIRATNDNTHAAVETLKYTLKPTQADAALRAFLYLLKNRRLISFTGILAKRRQEMKYSDFENVLTDDIDRTYRITYDLFEWDATGGYYRFTQKYEI